MKYILSILLIILSFSAFSQTRFPSVDSAKNYVLRYVKNSAVESFTNWRMQNVNYGTLELLDSLAGNGAIDSIWKSGDTLKYSKFGVNYTIGTVGGSVPTLQQVTTAGNSTTDSIISYGFIVNGITSDFSIEEDGAGSNRLAFKNRGGNYATIKSSSVYVTNSSGNYNAVVKSSSSTNNTNTLPDSSGVLTQRVSINGATYNTAANGVVDLGNVDTATVVKAFVHNAESVTINRGQVVYISGAAGDKASVRLASNLNDSLSARTFGFVRENIPAGGEGWVVTQGQITGINLGAYVEGDILWLDSVAGGFTKVRPEAPKHGVFLGVVERANAGNGILYVKVQNGQEISELHDVKITSPKTGDAITYTPSSQIWENRQVVLKQDTIPLAVFNVGSAARS